MTLQRAPAGTRWAEWFLTFEAPVIYSSHSI